MFVMILENGVEDLLLTINNKWKEPEIQYRSMKNRKLGEVQFVKVENDIIIANIIGQHLIIMNENENQSISYDAMKEGLKKVNELAIELNAVNTFS